MSALGLTLPLESVGLAAHRPLLRRLVEAGYADVWTGEVAGPDGLVPLALMRGWEPSITVSSGITSVFTRGPAVLAMSAAALAEAAPGAVRFGIGAGSKVVVEHWNSGAFERPYQRVADTLAFLRSVLAGERATPRTTLPGESFVLARAPEVPPKLMVGVAGPRMQLLAAAQADTMMVNFLGAADLDTVRAHCAGVARELPEPLETAARVFVLPRLPGEERETTETAARRFLAGYLTVPTYASFLGWLGRESELDEVVARWTRGDRSGAVAAVPQSLSGDLVVCGDPAEVAAGLARYGRHGAGVVSVALVPGAGGTPEEQVDFLVDVRAEWECCQHEVAR